MEVQENEPVISFTADPEYTNGKQIETFVRKATALYLSITFLTTVTGAFVGYLQHNPWRIGDWLINYQGGMIRRGFTGELAYQAASLTKISPGLYIVFLQIALYGIFFLFSYFMLRKQHRLVIYTFLIFSPFTFSFQINDFYGGFRKEIIYFALLAFTVWASKSFSHNTFERIFYLVLVLYPLVILTHEMLFIFLPYLLVVYFSVAGIKNGRTIIAPLLVLSLLSFIVSIYYSGSAAQITEISNSLAREGYNLKNGTVGAIDWLEKSTADGANALREIIIKDSYLIYYPLVLLLSLLAFIPVRKNLEFILKNKFHLYLILLSLFSTLLLFTFALDWGRFIYIHLVSLFLLSLLTGTSPDTNLVRTDAAVDERYTGGSILGNRYSFLFIAIFFIFYTLFWHIPHCCNRTPFPQNIKQINIIKYLKPYKNLYLMLNETPVETRHYPGLEVPVGKTPQK